MNGAVEKKSGLVWTEVLGSGLEIEGGEITVKVQ